VESTAPPETASPTGSTASTGSPPSTDSPVVEPLPESPALDLPETFAYKLKKRFLGPPLHTEELEHQRLGVPTALAVFSSDCISSSAYATEEILHILVPLVGVFAFSLVVPVTAAMIVVLVFLVLSYRQTVKEYPTAGGSYMVSRDNFGPVVGLVAGTSLLIGYSLTVAVSAAAGIAAVTSVVSALVPYRLVLSIVVTWLITLVNLRGVKESGKIFMVPTYLFIGGMMLMFAIGFAKLFGGAHIGHFSSAGSILDLTKHPTGKQGMTHTFLYGAGAFAVLQAFAKGGSAMTGVEAISNGVTAFRPTEWKNARKTLVWMAVILGTFFLGLSFFSTKVHPVPHESGSPTVISQVARQVFGHGALADLGYLFLQISTMLVLMLAANTSFADFPRLASFAAEDAFLPRQLTKRGHRLVFSNGILSLAVTATVLLLVTNATVNALIPLYAVGVFLSFTLSQSGMTKHHLTKREPGWQRSLAINGIGALLSAIVFLTILVTQFKQGAWVVVVATPLLILVFMRLNKQYESELAELTHEASNAPEEVVLKRHVVLVMVDKLSRAVGRALQYARTLSPDQVRAMHFAIDEQRARELGENWTETGLGRVPLQIVECPDRRVARAALEAAAAEAIDAETEVTVLIPRLEYRRFWHRFLHDRTGDEIAEALADLPHVNVTFVPFHLQSGRHSEQSAADYYESAKEARANQERLRTVTVGGKPSKVEASPKGIMFDVAPDAASRGTATPSETPSPIAAARFRQRVDLVGRVKVMEVQPVSGVAALEVTLADEGGQIQVVFLGRRTLAGLDVGSTIRVHGMVGQHRGRLALLNPKYELR
jgi:amino acid transporter